MSAPQSQEQGNPPSPQVQAERQRQIEALADEYLERLLAGETPDRQAFLAAHPELADLLGPRLELVELMHHVARAQRPAAGKPVNAVAGERVLRVKCPHCGNGIQLVEPESTEITCSGCGSSFHVEPGATTSFHSASLPRSIGRFEVLEQLGRGAFGIVYKARDPQLQRLVAVKVPRAGSFATPEEEERFLHEARAAAQLNHPGIVPVLEIAHDRNQPYIVSGYVEGLTLADMLTARRPGFRETAELTAAVADALDFAHRSRIVHRDIKPSNLLLDDAGRPHITDFGLARRGEPEITMTLDGQTLGTPAYMSPEQAAGDHQHVDARSDVYSLGVVLYELLTGELPFRGNQRMLLHQVIHDEPRPPRSLNDRVPRDLETICLKAMAKAPSRRYASAREMADDLRRFLNGEPIRARRVGLAEKMARWARRNPQVAVLMATVAFLLVTMTAVAISFALYQRQANRELADEKDKVERSQREAEVRAASAAVDLDLKHCEDGEIEYGVLRLARTLGKMPYHATELRQCVEMNLLAWAQEIRPLGPTFQYDGAETMWELSPDGLIVLTGGADGTARLWDAFTGEVRATLRGHKGYISQVAFSENGRVAMTVGQDETVRLWDARNGQAWSITSLGQPLPGTVRLGPDASRILTIYNETQDGIAEHAVVLLWDGSTGKRISELAGHTGQVNDAAFSADGKTILTGGNDKTARLWSADNGRAIGTLEGSDGPIYQVALNPDGTLAATLISTNTRPYSHVRWWDTRRRVQFGPPCYSKDSTGSTFRFVGREIVAAESGDEGGPFGGALYVKGMDDAIAWGSHDRTRIPGDYKADDEYALDGQGRIYELPKGTRRDPPAGRKFHPAADRFAVGRRFLLVNGAPTDLLTEKVIGNTQTSDLTKWIPDRQTFLTQSWPSPKYILLPDSTLDPRIAQLFAELVTCHTLDPDGTMQPLKETEWEERRRELARQLEQYPAPPLMNRLAADRWYWLRRQGPSASPPGAGGAPPSEEEMKYLDRLVAVEPIWQNYDWRAENRFSLNRWEDAVQDYLEAGRLAGKGYWHHRFPFRGPSASRLVDNLILTANETGRPEMSRLVLRLAEKLNAATPENRDRRIQLAIAHYRLGNYDKALSLLELWQREREREIIGQVGQFFMRPFPAPYLEAKILSKNAVEAMAFLAMTHDRLGHHDRARHALADLRRIGDSYSGINYSFAPFGSRASNRLKDDANYQNLRREAETLIEGKPRPDK